MFILTIRHIHVKHLHVCWSWVDNKNYRIQKAVDNKVLVFCTLHCTAVQIRIADDQWLHHPPTSLIPNPGVALVVDCNVASRQ